MSERIYPNNILVPLDGDAPLRDANGNIVPIRTSGNQNLN